MPRFTEGELEIMRILWDHGALKPAAIQEQFPSKITNSSLRSYLAILLEKNHLVRRRVGKAFFYRAKTCRNLALRDKLRDLTRAYCGGSVDALLCHLIRSQKLSAEDLIELKRLSEGDDPPANQKRKGNKR